MRIVASYPVVEDSTLRIHAEYLSDGMISSPRNSWASHRERGSDFNEESVPSGRQITHTD